MGLDAWILGHWPRMQLRGGLPQPAFNAGNMGGDQCPGKIGVTGTDGDKDGLVLIQGALHCIVLCQPTPDTGANGVAGQGIQKRPQIRIP